MEAIGSIYSAFHRYTTTAIVFINRHNLTMNLVEEKQRGLIPQGLQSWPLQLIEHLANNTSRAVDRQASGDPIWSTIHESRFADQTTSHWLIKK